jgi:hypothetical protein
VGEGVGWRKERCIVQQSGKCYKQKPKEASWIDQMRGRTKEEMA